MPGNRRVKYFHKCIVKYIDTGGASCPGIGRYFRFLRSRLAECVRRDKYWRINK
jgi:hypothetical protein